MPTMPAGPLDALTGKIRSAVAALTRELEPAELSVRLITQASLPVALKIQHSVAFSPMTTAGKGPLPHEVVALPSMAELQAQLNQRVQIARDEAGALIDKWAVESGHAYRSRLPPERCVIERPVLGVQEVCAGCRGSKQLTCGGCAGAGRQVCGSCGGRGRVSCSSCGGSKATRCFSCGGSGTREVRELDLSYTDRQNDEPAESADPAGAV